MPNNNSSNGTFFTVIVGCYIGAIVISIGLASKFFSIGPWVFNGSILTWPITFVFNDILTEVYGYSRSRQIIWTGLTVEIFAAAMYTVLGMLPSAPFWKEQIAFDLILGQAPRMVLASSMAYFWGEYINSMVLSKLKYKEAGVTGILQGVRFVVSTAAGEAVDTAIFYPLAFVGTIPLPHLLETMTLVYCAKVLYEIVALPASMFFAEYIKKKENTNIIDNPLTTDYSPLIIHSLGNR